MQVVKAYRNLWEEIKGELVRFPMHDGQNVFQMPYATNRWAFDGNHSEDEDGEEFTMIGEVRYDRATESLRIILAEVNEEEWTRTILSEQPLFDEGGSEAE